MADDTKTFSSPENWNVCLVVSGPNTGGGIERHVRDLAHGLATRHSITVLAHESFEPLFDSRVNFLRVPFTRWRFDIFLLVQVIRTIRSLNPNVVHAHGRKAAQVIAFCRRFFTSSCVLTVHNLSKSARLFRRFDSVIAVSDLVARGLDHPRSFTVLNGCK